MTSEVQGCPLRQSGWIVQIPQELAKILEPVPLLLVHLAVQYSQWVGEFDEYGGGGNYGGTLTLQGLILEGLLRLRGGDGEGLLLQLALICLTKILNVSDLLNCTAWLAGQSFVTTDILLTGLQHCNVGGLSDMLQEVHGLEVGDACLWLLVHTACLAGRGGTCLQIGLLTLSPRRVGLGLS